MSDGLNRLLGDSPLRVIVKLVIISVVVGFVMTMFGFSPRDLFYIIKEGIEEVWRSGFRAIGRIGDYLLVGAIVVIPVFIILRILNWRKS